MLTHSSPNRPVCEAVYSPYIFHHPYVINSICPEEIFSKELVIFGVLSNPYSMARAVPMAANMSDSYLDLDKLGVATFKLEDYKKAMDRLKTAEISKAVFKF